MAHDLIMPKQTGQMDVFLASLQLFYEAHINDDEWVLNSDYKEQIQVLLPYLAQGAQDGAYLVKQSELTRYFGFAEHSYDRPGRTKITDRGVEFYNAYLNKNSEKMTELLMESIFDLSFGRNNTAIKSSDSDVDAPKLFIKAMFDLGAISRKDLAYLLFVVHDKKIRYEDALKEFKTRDEDKEIIIPEDVRNKYSDVKFTVLLTSFGICEETEDKKYTLNQFIKQRYAEQISAMSVYNTQPDVVYSMEEELDSANYENIEDLLTESDVQNKVLTSFAYDTNSDKFKRQNTRRPTLVNPNNKTKYKTNPRIAKTALVLAECKCAIDAEQHTTFISKSGHQYMEAHHLVPMHAQKDFEVNLDRIENIISICPVCHSAIHLGSDAVRLELLKILYDANINALRTVGIDISFSDLYLKYYK